MTSAAVVAAVLVGGLGGAHVEPGRRASRPLSIADILQIRYPSQPTWAPDGQRLAFVWDVGGVANIWIADVASSGVPRAATSFAAGTVDNLFWARDGRALYFARAGDLWRVDPGLHAQPEAVWTTAVLESQIVPSPDGRQVAFVRGGRSDLSDWQRTEGDLWVRTLADGHELQLTHGEGVVSGPAWSPDGRFLAFSIGRATRRAEAPEYSGAKIEYTRVDHGPASAAFVPSGGGPITRLPESPGWDPSLSWLDSSHLLTQRVEADNRTRRIIVADVPSGATRTLYEEVDAKFWSLPFIAPDPVPSPDGRVVALVSDRDGWDHLYLVPAAGGTPRQVTSGRFEVRHLAWSPDGRSLAFDRSVDGQPGVRHLAVAAVADNGSVTGVSATTTGHGTNIAPQWSPDGRRLVYQHADAHNSPDLWLVSPASDRASDPRRLTDSMPATIDREALVEPQLVGYRAPDGRQVPAYLFVPKGVDRSAGASIRHPAIVWIHGDGINQNYDGWHVERNYAVYYALHQYLLQRGYVVLAPDYRGSIGYGREWRQGVYMDVGGRDADDAAAAADYLKTLPQVDGGRIGVWGLSYGGFFTLIALADHPTAFRCGIDVAGVSDYRMWYEDPGGAWVVARMGTPESNPALYDRAAVVGRVGHIVRPLLVLHGTADMNVPYIESIRLVDEMLRGNKDVEFMTYPGEFHYFQRAHVLRDAWNRVSAFFDRNLR